MSCRLCSQTALDVAFRNGHTETVKALVGSGARSADVHTKDLQGYGRRLHRGRSTLHLRRTVRCGHMLAVQEDGAAPCLREGPCGAGEGAGGIGRGRARQGLPRVRSAAVIVGNGPWLLIRMVRRGLVLAVQVDSAAPCLREGPHGDGEGTGVCRRGRERIVAPRQHIRSERVRRAGTAGRSHKGC